ncbi:hypothetical protein SFRURICE_012574 [Spodoptera frugiperda]|nr:hypothetical protein SFRURICE_012574 [Spodoptera frugiperda]
MGVNKFTVHQNEGMKTRWRCVKKTRGCQAFVITIDNVIIRQREDHNHE